MTFPVFASGDILSHTDMNAVGLWRVRAETTFTTVSSITLPASTFTSTYKFYKIVLQFTATTDGSNLTFQVRSGSTTATTAYYATTNRVTFLGTTSNLLSNNAASATLCSVSGTGGNAVIMELGNGFGSSGMASWTSYMANPNQAASVIHSGVHQVSQNNDAAVISISAGTITGTYSVYGYKP